MESNRIIKEILKHSDEIKATRFELFEGGWSVFVYNEFVDFGIWVDCFINEKYHDIETEWNQYIFYTDHDDDRIRRDVQNNCDIFDLYTNEAVSYLQYMGIITQNEDGEWHKIPPKYCIIHHSEMTDTKLYFICDKKEILLNNEKLINDFINYENYEKFDQLKKELTDNGILFVNSEEDDDDRNTNNLIIIKKYYYRF